VAAAVAAGEVLERQLSYWREQLSGMPAALELPTDRPRPSNPSFKGAQHAFALPKECVEALKELSRGEGVTLYMVCSGVAGRVGALEWPRGRDSGLADSRAHASHDRGAARFFREYAGVAHGPVG